LKELWILKAISIGDVSMEYKFTPNENYEDYAAGRVIYHMGGEPTFPVRLSLEIYERCLRYSDKKTGITLYDCCCGGAYMLTILGLLKSNTISRIYGTDIDAKSLKLAADNLSLLTKTGIHKRREELEALYKSYEKASHLEALQSVERFEQLRSEGLQTSVFYRNAFEASDLPFIPDMIITDVPYGNMVEWDEGSGGINEMMDALSQVCGQNTVICICMDKKQKINTEIYQRLERQLIGKRKFEIYKKKILEA
jgi:tRNA G10  N-methylase Trm11